MNATQIRPDAVLAAAADVARQAAVDAAGAAMVGDALGFAMEDDRVGTHSFACLSPAYVGWQWAVTITRAPRSKTVTVDDVVLLPGAAALVAPPWVPWAERVLPGWDDQRHLPSLEDARLDMVRNSCRALGVVKAGWVADYYRLGRGRFDEDLHRLADAGELLPVRIEGWKHDAFVHHSLSAELAEAEANRLSATRCAALSPFDPIVWDRKRALELFDFDYKIECYTPAPKRRFGYFSLPLLQRGKLVGRMDAKAHRQQGIFEVKSLYLESGVRESGRLATDLARTLSQLAGWHGTPRLRFNHGPAGLLAGIQAQLAEGETDAAG